MDGHMKDEGCHELWGITGILEMRDCSLKDWGWWYQQSFLKSTCTIWMSSMWNQGTQECETIPVLAGNWCWQYRLHPEMPRMYQEEKTSQRTTAASWCSREFLKESGDGPLWLLICDYSKVLKIMVLLLCFQQWVVFFFFGHSCN